WGATCTAYNHRVLSDIAGEVGKIDLVYHGLDLARFPAPPVRSGAGPLRILSVCRAVEKKGLDDVLRALSKLPADLDWRFEHVGGGSMVPQLKARAERMGILPRVAFLGAMDRADVIAAYARADLFVLASRIARNGDRDGLPNVIMEAMAMGLPVVSTAVSAVPEIVTEETGLLVSERDPSGLTAAIARLAGDPALRRAMGAAGAARVREAFSPAPGLARLMERFCAEGVTRRAA
ncbi:MAG: glycosyltransferase family 4 protein, partial [Pseudomonadota bacterium]